MSNLIYLNYSAIAILFSIILTAYSRHITKIRTSRLFITSVILVLVATISYTAAIFMENANLDFPWLINLGHTVYLLAHFASVIIYYFYIITLTDTWHNFVKSKIFFCLILLPAVIVVCLLLFHFFNHPVLCAENNYVERNLFFFSYFCACFYVCGWLFHLIKYRKILSGEFLKTNIFYISLALISTLLQLLFPELTIGLFASACGLLFVFGNIKGPEDQLDPVTGLENNTAYAEKCQNAFSNKKKLIIILINITNYKTVLSILGYTAGQKLVKLIAHVLQQVNSELKLKAHLYHTKSGAFSVVVSRHHFYLVDEAAERIRKALNHVYTFDGIEINLSATICIARCPDDIVNFDELVLLSQDMKKRLNETNVLAASDLFQKEYYSAILNIDRIIDNAISTHKLDVYYQPIYSIEEKRFVSAEALIRLKDDIYGYISPEVFIPAAERSGAIHKIGEYVLEEVCRFISSPEFSVCGLDYIEINLSVVQCMQDNLAGCILAILLKHSVAPQRINLEITETAFAQYQEKLEKNIKKLTDAGISISLDDFGSGFSNILRIYQLPFSIIKLDKIFTNNVDNPKVSVILKQIIEMMKELNLKTVVEGIETESCLKKFEELGCDYVQGEYYSRPLSKEDFIILLSKETEKKGLQNR